MADKNFDPRFDPAFQRGYASGERSERAEAAFAASAVDSYREESVSANATQGTPRSSAAGDGRAAASASSAFEPPAIVPLSTAAVSSAGLPPAPDARTPQSQYVDDAGATVDAMASEAVKKQATSLARNPWLYILWGTGVIGLAGAAVALWWANSILYGVGNPQVESYEMVATVQSIAPIGVSFGSLALVGALLLHGLSWMRMNS